MAHVGGMAGPALTEPTPKQDSHTSQPSAERVRPCPAHSGQVVSLGVRDGAFIG